MAYVTKRKSAVTVVLTSVHFRKLIQKMFKVGVKNPPFLLDEIDKMSSGYAW
ncbi:hypothetical protein O9992_14680 [Vibrio lentus]|nr:hypothetical protein [Vibrio lentus]